MSNKNNGELKIFNTPLRFKRSKPTIEQLIRLLNTTIRAKYTGAKGVYIKNKPLIEKVYMPKNKYLKKYDKTVYRK